MESIRPMGRKSWPQPQAALVALLVGLLLPPTTTMLPRVAATAGSPGAVTAKRGTSGLVSCDDADALKLRSSWTYNWGLDPKGHSADSCTPPRAAEFVPMFWSCYQLGCAHSLPTAYVSLWKRAGVKFLLGFNEPDCGWPGDKPCQAGLSPSEAAKFWPEIQSIASSFVPPLQLVAPAMARWGPAGSLWLDFFIGNCTALPGCEPSSIKYLAFHDYSGSPAQIIAKANAAFQKYRRKIWLTEFAVGNGRGSRTHNDNFMRQVLPLLDKTDSIYRYAWYSTRNQESTFVESSNLLPPPPPPPSGWMGKLNTACSLSTMVWQSQHGSLEQCEAHAEATATCTSPKTVAWEQGSLHNCFCANTTCAVVHSTWLQLWTKHTARQVAQPPNLTLTSTGRIYALGNS
jgi:hypothetical protein